MKQRLPTPRKAKTKVSHPAYLRVKPNSTEEDARRHASVGLVYDCPECMVGHALIQIDSETVRCGLCGGTYLKP
jgi:hypothetical protein